MIRRPAPVAVATVVTIVTLLAVAAGCGADNSSNEVGEVRSDRCVIRLHGKGGSGSTPQLTDVAIAIVNPDGNGTGWGGREWRYDSAESLDAGREVIVDAADRAECRRVVIHGFSNGASMAAALFCSGNDLDGRLVGVIVDDPVTDRGTINCRPSGVPVEVYWTTALDQVAPPGTLCETVDWTCDGDVIRGIEAYAGDLGVTALASPYDEHQWYLDSPLPIMWLE